MKRSHIIALVLAVGALAWVLSGQLGDQAVTAEAQKPPAVLDAAKAPTKVRVRRSTAERHVAELVLRGRTEAERTVDVRAEASGRIVELELDKGERAEADQLIARLDDNGRGAALAEAKALLKQRQVEFQAADKLSEKGFRAATQLAAAQAALQAAEAAVRKAQVQVDNTRITTPFEGVVDERMVELGDFVEIGDPILRIVDLDPIVVVAHVSEQNLARLKAGTVGEVRLLTGERLAGGIAFIASMADPETRTFRVELEVPNPDGAVADGISAELALPAGEGLAHKVSPAVLTLSDEGLVGVKAVDADGRARFLPARILDYRADWVWLTGLPESFTLITVGQEFVADGQKVEPIEESEIAPAGGGKAPGA